MKPIFHLPSGYFASAGLLVGLAGCVGIAVNSLRVGAVAFAIVLVLFLTDKLLNRPPDDQDKWR